VNAQLDIPSSNRGTFFSARNEALRSAEQVAMDEAEVEVETSNKRTSSAGEQPIRILNKHRAAVEPGLWQGRHKVVAAEGWKLLKEGVAPGLNTANALVSVVDAYKFARQQAEAKYGWAPYVMEDKFGSFTVRAETSWLVVHSYYKTYLSGPLKDKRVEVDEDLAVQYLREAEALWGTTDWTGEFVPGLFMPELPLSTGSID